MLISARLFRSGKSAGLSPSRFLHPIPSCPVTPGTGWHPTCPFKSLTIMMSLSIGNWSHTESRSSWNADFFPCHWPCCGAETWIEDVACSPSCQELQLISLSCGRWLSQCRLQMVQRGWRPLVHCSHYLRKWVMDYFSLLPSPSCFPAYLDRSVIMSWDNSSHLSVAAPMLIVAKVITLEDCLDLEGRPFVSLRVSGALFFQPCRLAKPVSWGVRSAN